MAQNIISNIIKKLVKNQEMEVSFYDYSETQQRITPINTEQYVNILKYIRHNKNKYKVSKEVSLDIIHTETGGLDYRISLSGTDEINKRISNLYTKPNYIVFKVLCEKLGKNALIRKIKDDIIDIDDYFLRAKINTEYAVSESECVKIIKSMNENRSEFILFRDKERVSMIILNDEDIKIQLDVTKVRMSNNLQEINKIYAAYELELEIFVKTENKISSDTVKLYYGQVVNIIKCIQQSQHIITRSVADNVLNEYAKLLNISADRISSLDGMQSVSLEIQHVLDNLPNQYNVTDKADGDRNFLLCNGNNAYLISNTIRIRNTGLTVAEELNGTLLDGELVYIPKYKKHMFLIFDVLFIKGKDVRGTISLLSRLEMIDNIMPTLVKDYKVYKPKTSRLGGDELKKFYKTEYLEYFGIMNKNLKSENRDLVIQKKFFMNPSGAQDNEVFKFSNLIWETCTKDDICPYNLDGIIFTPLEQKYTKNLREVKKPIYKLKPEEKNSIDFFIIFEKDNKTGEILTLFDNSNDNLLKGKLYRIAKLYVGLTIGGKERPVLFQQPTKEYYAYLYLDRGAIRDISGNPIEDKTVVEMYYDTKYSDVESKYRWVPIKTRYDKTDSVARYGKKYGNYEDIANKVWRSILNPIKMDDINILSNDKNFKIHSSVIRQRVSKSLVAAERRESAYYQLQTNLAKPQRNFHNWIKSNLIYTLFNPQYQQGKRMAVLDYACGRGGDIMKFFYARIDWAVLFDIDLKGLTSSIDAAVSRYEKFKVENRNFPPMYFIHADGGALLNAESQEKALGGTTEENKKLIRRFFENNAEEKRKYQRFDRINCQFAIHYFLKDNMTWNNFCENIKKFLTPGGFIVITCFDAHAIIKAFSNNNKITGYYTNENGDKKILFDIVKNYELDDIKKPIGTGYAIDYYNATFQEEGEYATEYLVDKRFLIKELHDKCGLVLAETDMFSTLYEINREYFMKTAHWEEYYKTRKFLLDTKKYYEQKDEIDKTSLEMTKLYRYYVFHKLPIENDEYIIKYKDWKSEGDLFKKRVPHKTRFEKMN